MPANGDDDQRRGDAPDRRAPAAPGFTRWQPISPHRLRRDGCGSRIRVELDIIHIKGSGPAARGQLKSRCRELVFWATPRAASGI